MVGTGLQSQGGGLKWVQAWGQGQQYWGKGWHQAREPLFSPGLGSGRRQGSVLWWG